MLSTKSIAAALSAAALTGICAQSAAADSISYLKGGDVWLATPDGSRHFQVTQTGGYKSASQSDDGTIVALKGQRIHKLDRLGNVLADISTAVSDGEDDRKMIYASHFEGPHEVDLSPDGKKVAYNFHWQYWTTFGGSSTGYHMLRQGVGVSAVDRTTSWSDPGMGYQTGWLDSAWYDDDTLMYAKKASYGMMDTAVNEVGRDNTGSTNWFYHTALADMRQPAVSPNKDLIAVVGDSNNEFSKGQQMWVWKSGGEAPALPPRVCNAYGNAVGDTMTSPTFSPDSRGLAWQEGDGIRVLDGIDQCSSESDAKLVIPGGEEPDWAAAGVPASRPAPAEQPKPTPPPAPNTQVTQPKVVVPVTATEQPKVKGSQSQTSLMSVSIPCRASCTITGQVLASRTLVKRHKLSGKVLATGKARRSSKGAVQLQLRLTGAGRKAAGKLGARKLTLRVTVKEGGRLRRLSRKVALR